jgi:hypothetical protein
MKAYKQEQDPYAYDDSKTSADEYELLTAAEAASVLRVARKFVYAHAKELGGSRLLGDRGPWRFQRRQLLARVLSAPEPALPRRRRARSNAASRKPTHTPNGAPILPSEPREPVNTDSLYAGQAADGSACGRGRVHVAGGRGRLQRGEVNVLGVGAPLAAGKRPRASHAELSEGPQLSATPKPE